MRPFVIRPPESPLAMPPQDFAAPADAGVRKGGSRLWRKAFVGAASLVIASWASHEMYRVLAVADMTFLEWLLLILFTANIVWIVFAFVSGTAGFLAVLLERLGGDAKHADETAPIKGKTVIVFPIYNEDVRRIIANVEATSAALEAAAPGRFEFFILSDSTNPDTALLEEEAFLRLKKRLGAGAPAFYRRRTINHARKSGNIHDFISRWGGRYDYMIVYDADSYMETSTLLELVRRLEASPQTGLIQTIPNLINARTIFARAQQFAANMYGPVLGAGVAWWAQDEGNFWGHNAIIRVKAFAEAAGLPAMSGKAPFGGDILSHDFVEAALLRRAGWRVKIAHDLGGSWEECPPTIIDLTIRDRRWCQGNLQHLGVLARARGLLWTSRLHMIIGVMAYLASPLWFLFIVVGMALSLQGRFLQPEYFGDGLVLVPKWPVIDSARALTLFIITMGILFAPKIYGLIAGLASPAWRKSVGVLKMASGVIVETIISALVAPILMAAQSSAVLSVLAGGDSGWAPQRRGDKNYSPSDVFRRHARTMLVGLALFIMALSISPVFAAWLSPAAAGLILAGFISTWTGSNIAGGFFRRAGIMATPTEKSSPRSYALASDIYEAYADLTAPSFLQLLRDETLQDRRTPLIDAHWPLATGDIHSPLATAVARAQKIESLDLLASALSPAEKMALLNAPTELSDITRKHQRAFPRRRAAALPPPPEPIHPSKEPAISAAS